MLEARHAEALAVMSGESARRTAEREHAAFSKGKAEALAEIDAQIKAAVAQATSEAAQSAEQQMMDALAAQRKELSRDFEETLEAMRREAEVQLRTRVLEEVSQAVDKQKASGVAAVMNAVNGLKQSQAQQASAPLHRRVPVSSGSGRRDPSLKVCLHSAS